jgi:hypothetical protein
LCSHSSSITAVQKIWLVPLLNRTPLAPVVVALLELTFDLDSESLKQLVHCSSAVINALWPLSYAKMTAEALMDCFGSFLVVLPKIADHLGDLLSVGKLVSSSLKNAYGNSSNKKKVRQ